MERLAQRGVINKFRVIQNTLSICQLKRALHIAAEYGHLPLFIHLIDCGACMDDFYSRFYPLNKVMENGHIHIFEYLYTNYPTINSYTLSHVSGIAGQYGHLNIIKLYTEKFKIPYQPDLHAVIKCGHTNVMDYILSLKWWIKGNHHNLIYQAITNG